MIIHVSVSLCNFLIRHLSLCGTLCVEPVMSHPDFIHRFILYTDASQVPAGAVLAEDGDYLETVVTYASRSLTAAER